MLTASADWKNGQFMYCSVQIPIFSKNYRIINSGRTPGLESSTPVCTGRRTIRNLHDSSLISASKYIIVTY